MKKGDKIIWDSGFGYDIGFYVKPSKILINCYEVDLVSGFIKGEMHVPKIEIKPYSKKLASKLAEKYLCLHTFPSTKKNSLDL